MTLSRVVSGLLCVSLLFSMGACMSSSEEKAQEQKDEDTKEKKTAEAKAAVETYKPKLICPQVAIIRELEDIRDHGDGGDPHSLVAEAKMTSVDGTCSYQDKGIDLAFKLKFASARGPQMNGEQAQFPYFVAVIDPDQNILNKDVMTEKVHLRASEPGKIVEQEENLHVFIPLPKDNQSKGPSFRVLTGFQLDEGQLRDVRRQENAATAMAPKTP